MMFLHSKYVVSEELLFEAKPEEMKQQKQLNPRNQCTILHCHMHRIKNEINIRVRREGT